MWAVLSVVSFPAQSVAICSEMLVGIPDMRPTVVDGSGALREGWGKVFVSLRVEGKRLDARRNVRQYLGKECGCGCCYGVQLRRLCPYDQGISCACFPGRVRCFDGFGTKCIKGARVGEGFHPLPRFQRGSRVPPLQHEGNAGKTVMPP